MPEVSMQFWWKEKRDLEAPIRGKKTFTTTATHNLEFYEKKSHFPSVRNYVISSEAHAKDVCWRCLTMIKFMDATGLVASQAWSRLFNNKYSGECGIPGPFDHTFVWYYPVTKEYIITTEPYMGHHLAVGPWAEKFGWGLVTMPKGYGMWCPGAAGELGGTRLCILKHPKFGASLEGLQEVLEKLMPQRGTDD